MGRFCHHLKGNLPRLMFECEAAAYCSMTIEQFRVEFLTRISPYPSSDGEKRYDRYAIDKVIDDKTGVNSDANANALSRDLLARTRAYAG